MHNFFSLADFSMRFQQSNEKFACQNDSDLIFNSDMAISYRLMEATSQSENLDYDAPHWKNAAVLIIIMNYEQGAKVLLTERSSALRNHSGQVSFPGGRIDESDSNAIDAALREAEEEIALQKDNVTILGQLPFYFTGTGYKIAPIVAVMPSLQDFIINPQEVTNIFEVPLEFLMNPNNHQKIHKQINGKQRSWYALSYQNHLIWGATAGMIVHLYERLYA